jgi:hypothetical protein
MQSGYIDSLEYICIKYLAKYWLDNYEKLEKTSQSTRIAFIKFPILYKDIPEHLKYLVFIRFCLLKLPPKLNY